MGNPPASWLLDWLSTSSRKMYVYVVVADGTPEATRRLERVLTTDPGMGVARHADADYPEAIAAARRHGIHIPMLKDA